MTYQNKVRADRLRRAQQRRNQARRQHARWVALMMRIRPDFAPDADDILRRTP
jgi:hypothetical protein